MNRNLTTSSMTLAALLIVGCGSDPKPEPNVGNGPMMGPAPVSTQANADDGGGSADGVGVDERIAKMCDLATSYFDFDSANVSSEARSVLNKIASCFKDGPGKDQNLNIVGHADPRGETEYNFALGQRRAGAVAGYLTKAGLAETRIETSSRGELEATGTEEQSWAKDRKVEILLAD